jgi:hypothetical protein
VPPPVLPPLPPLVLVPPRAPPPSPTSFPMPSPPASLPNSGGDDADEDEAPSAWVASRDMSVACKNSAALLSSDGKGG